MSSLDQDISKQDRTTVLAALKKIKNVAFPSPVWSAFDGDRERRGRATWTMIREGKVDLAKNWSISAVLADEGTPAPRWSDVALLLSKLPDSVIEAGGGNKGMGWIMMTYAPEGETPAYFGPGVPATLMHIVVRAALSEPEAFAAYDPSSLSPTLRNVVEYARGVAGLPLDEQRRARVLTAMAHRAVTNRFPHTFVVRGDHGAPVDRRFWSGDADEPLPGTSEHDLFPLVERFATREEWGRSLAAALRDELRLHREGARHAMGIGQIQQCQDGLAQLTVDELVEALVIGDADGDPARFEAHARHALARLDPAQRAAAKAHAATLELGRSLGAVTALLDG